MQHSMKPRLSNVGAACLGACSVSSESVPLQSVRAVDVLQSLFIPNIVVANAFREHDRCETACGTGPWGVDTPTR